MLASPNMCWTSAACSRLRRTAGSMEGGDAGVTDGTGSGRQRTGSLPTLSFGRINLGGLGFRPLGGLGCLPAGLLRRPTAWQRQACHPRSSAQASVGTSLLAASVLAASVLRRLRCRSLGAAFTQSCESARHHWTGCPSQCPPAGSSSVSGGSSAAGLARLPSFLLGALFTVGGGCTGVWPSAGRLAPALRSALPAVWHAAGRLPRLARRLRPLGFGREASVCRCGRLLPAAEAV